MEANEYQESLSGIRKVIAEGNPNRTSVKPERYRECLGELWNVVDSLMPRRQYHNPQHAVEVMERYEYLGRKEKLTGYEIFLGKSASLLHDINPDSELFSALFSVGYLHELEYPLEDIETVTRLIISTKMPTDPQDLLERVICDADVDNFGRKDFFEKGELIRQELGVRNIGEWYQKVCKLLKSRPFYTAIQQQERGEQLQRNIAELERRIREMRMPLLEDKLRSEEMHEGNQLYVNPCDELHEGTIGARILTITPRYRVN